MRQYNIVFATKRSNDELQHYGVKGMKWGVRRSIKNTVEKRREKIRKRDESYAKTQKYFGVGGVGIRSGAEYASKKAIKGVLAKSINVAANTYISKNGANNYQVSRGVDFVRRASVTALSISSAADQIRVYSDLGKAAMRNR